MGIDNYLCAKEDVENAAVPSRHGERFGFTNGMMKILERPLSEVLRSFSARYQQLEEQKKDVVVSITDHEATLTILEEENANKEKEAQEALEIKSQALAFKKDIRKNHERVMRTNGLTLAKDEPTEKPQKKPEAEPAVSWNSRLRSFGVFMGIEALAFVASYVILRENLSDMEVYTRLIANGFVFFIIDYLLRKKDHSGRSAFLIIFMVLYAFMLLSPLLVEFMGSSTAPAGDAWGFDQGTEPVAPETLGFGDFLLHNASLVLVVMAIICLVTYLGFYNKKQSPLAEAKQIPDPPEAAPTSDTEVMYSSLHGLNRDVSALEEEVNQLETENKALPMQLLSDFSLLRDTLIGLDKKWQELGMQQQRMKQEVATALDKVMNELKEYQDHYQSMLSGTTNSFVFKPQWPTEQDLRIYYKIENGRS